MAHNVVMSDETSSVLVQSLATRLAAYPGSVTRIELLETHISWIFLAGEGAYKVKKPVDLGFVDFSTLERRRQFCEEELRLNRRLAPKLYLDVLPITGSPEAPQVGGEGTAIEYCVHMRRFEQEKLLSRLVAAGELLPRQIDALAREVAEFHAGIPVARPASWFGTPEAVAEPIRANFTHLDRPENGEVKELVERLRAWCERELAAREDDLIARKRNGFIRECHGDMHLGNMILADAEITIFDCIEFNADLRWIDVASEIAFCTMDLEDRGRADLARRFLNGALEWSGDYAGLAVLPLYLVYRALVRAKVAALRRRQLQMEQGGISSGENERLARELANYLGLAERSTRRRTVFLAVTHGLSGSGKTSGSQAVVEGFGAIRVRSDIERKRLAGLPPLAATGSGVGSGLYSAESSRRTFDRLAELAATIIAAGFPAIVDATFLRRAEREQFHELADRLRVPFLILDFPTDEATCHQRIDLRAKEGADASEATETVLDHQLQIHEALDDGERALAVSFDGTQPQAIEAAVAQIEARRGQFPPPGDV
jgi:aminoglycoside phosphotransferase family enzyme/predicted kinase